MILLDHEQGSIEWLRARAGVFTASALSDLMATTQAGKPAASRGNLITRLAIERITGEPLPTYQNEAMRRGTELEPFARAAYEAETGAMVQTVGLAIHAEYPFAGASMDGLVGSDGLVELKCPDSQAKHVQALRSGAHADEYRMQIMGQLWVSGRAWCDAVSFDPRFPEGLQLAIVRVQRDEAAISAIETAVRKAHAETESLVAELLAMRKSA